MGKPCVAGAEHLQIDADARTFTVDGTVVSEGDQITIDGGTGEVMLGAVPLVPAQLNEDFETITGWADEVRRLRVRANADTPADAAKARELGAEGIGLCRTEHMFFGDERLPVVQAHDHGRPTRRTAGRAARPRCCRSSRPTSRGIFEAMAGLPVTIRLLDPPLHEFLPDARRPGRGDRARPRRGPAARPRSPSWSGSPAGCGRWPSRTRCWAPRLPAGADVSPRSTRCRCGRSCVPRSRSRAPRASRSCSR